MRPLAQGRAAVNAISADTTAKVAERRRAGTGISQGMSRLLDRKAYFERGASRSTVGAVVVAAPIPTG